MRRLETLLLLSCLGVTFVNYTGGSGAVGAGILLLILCAHVLVERARWQLSPLYLVTTMAIILGVAGWSLSPLAAGLVFFGGALMLLASLACGLGIPIRGATVMTGPHHVGTSTFHLTQLDRVDVHGAADGAHQLMMQVWYPAVDTGEPAADYLPDFEVGSRLLAKAHRMPGFGLRHMQLTGTNATIDSPLAHSDDRFPVLLFSHGRSGTRGQNTYQVEELVSHGYVVAAVDHPYGAGYTVYPDGTALGYDRSIFGDDTPEEAGPVIDEWVKDLVCVLDTMEDFNTSQTGFFRNALDLDRVGIFGHSAGAGAAMELCSLENRCGPVLAYDPWVVPTSDDVIAAGLDEPVLVLKQPDPLGPTSDARLRQLLANTKDSSLLDIEGTKHLDFNDYKLLVPALEWIGVTGSIDGERLRDILNSFTRAFFDAHLRNFPPSEVLSNLALHPEVRSS